MIKSHKFAIGDITISVEGDFQDTALEIPVAYRPFIGKGKKQITLHLHEGVSSPVAGEKVFESPPIWSLYRENGTSILKIFEYMPESGRTLVLPRNVKNADLYFDDPSCPYSDPFYGPTLELLMVNYLARGRGIIIHGCGIKHGDRGVLFVGESGAGKTTMARIWDQQIGVEVLSDDRTIVRKKGEHFWIYGTPWHGEGKFGSPKSARLDQIFFIRHGNENSVGETRHADSVTRFLKCSFPPLWDVEGVEYSLGVFSEMAAAVPCHELSFKPDSEVIEFLFKRS